MKVCEEFDLQAGWPPAKPSRSRGRNFRHPLETVLFTAIVGLACGQKTFTAIVDFVDAQHQWFALFLDMKNGPPSEDTYRRVLEAVSPEQLGRVFSKWAALLMETLEQEVIAMNALRRLPTFKGNLAQAGRHAAFNLKVRESESQPVQPERSRGPFDLAQGERGYSGLI